MNIENSQTVQIISTLRDVGVPAHLLGYGFLKQAIGLVLSDKTYLRSVSRRLYPEIAKATGTTAPRVERGIRHAVEIAYGRAECSKDYIKFFRSLTDQPTNSEFIATVAEAIELRNLEGADQ